MDDIQIHKIKVKKAKRKQEACGWCLGWRGDACRGGSVCDKLAILRTVSPKGTSVKASLSPSPVRQAPFVLGFLEPHFSAWSHRERTPQWKGGENPCVCGRCWLCPLLPPSGSSEEGLDQRATVLGNPCKRVHIYRVHLSSVFSACWERTDALSGPSFSPRGV